MNDEVVMLVLFLLLCAIAAAKLLQRDVYSQDIYIGPGTYEVGRDIPAGKADLVAVSGGGDFCLMEHQSQTWNVSSKIGATSPLQPNRFRNLALNKGDILEVNGNVKLMITPCTPVTDVMTETLGPGNYRFGVDAPAGRYNLEVVSGDGVVYLTEVGQTDYTFFQDMAAGNDFKAQEYSNLSCGKGYEMWIEGSLQLKLTHSAKQDIWTCP